MLESSDGGLTVQGVADRLGVNPETVREWLRQGVLEGTQQSRKAGWRVSPAAVDAFTVSPEGRRRLALAGRTPGGEAHSARVIAITNQKGGVGKTTTAANLGYALAELGKRVLVVDMDPQANLTVGLGAVHAAEKMSIVDVLRSEDRLLSEAIHKTQMSNLDIAPSHINLADAEQLLASRFGRDTVLRDSISDGIRAHYDYVLLDSPPNFGLLSTNSMVAADELIIPVATHFYALQGMTALLERVKLVRRKVNPTLRVAGLLATRYDARAVLCREVVAKLPEFGEPVFKTIIHEAIRVAEAPAWQQTVLEFKPNSSSADQYRSLAAEIEGGPVAVPREAASAE